MTTSTPPEHEGFASRPRLRLDLSDRACPVCGSSEARLFAPANVDVERLDGFAFSSRKRPEFMHFRLVVCTSCDLLYSTPAPTERAIEQGYEGASFDASEESRYASQTYAAFLHRICRRLPDRAGALDIGSGDGAFLAQLLAHGFTDVVGVEPSAAPIAVAHPAIRPLIRQRPFRADEYEAAQFRLVTCFQTVEHVYDPMQLCRDALRIIKPQGAFFVVCHNRNAVLARILGLRSPIFDIEHLQLFSPKSIRTMLRRAGFARVEIHVMVNRYPVGYWARLAPLPDVLKNALLTALGATSLGRIELSAPVGNLAVIAYK